ncbi:MAG: chromosomal replication initiator protein DnaA [Bryobacterales bacterium]|nr:chromosomal replication initiator protein DnaA [Bryobacterales bacterium]
MDIYRMNAAALATMNFWDQIKQCLSSRVSAESFQNWIHNTSFNSASDGVLTVSVPNEATKEFMEEEYDFLVQSVVQELRFPFKRVLYQISDATQQQPASLPAIGSDMQFAAAANRLNARFTFENFVVGSCNQFAHAAAKAVANMPSKTYNPLFIYGGVGIGKTHLMHAIGRALLNNFSGMRIVYTASERFMNEMISCIRLDRMPLFHQHYRSADVLLIDDIHVLSGKERTQEEFFHTFNELYDHQKQIVISSDSSPKNIPGLVERLRSRFEWGLMVDMQPPDLETKMAILDAKAEAEGVRLPEDVRIFIATRTKHNVRELEGALTKLMAYSSVTDSPINLAMAQQVLKHLTAGQDRKITIDAIIRAVAEHFHMQPAQLKLKTNVRQIAYPRQIAMYLAKELTGASLPELGKAFAGKHHTTVLHSIQKIEKLRAKDEDLHRTIQSLIDSLH